MARFNRVLDTRSRLAIILEGLTLILAVIILLTDIPLPEYALVVLESIAFTVLVSAFMFHYA